MALSIRNQRAERLAREVASATGEGLTEAIIRALEERLEHLRHQQGTEHTVEEIMTISRRCAALPDLDTRSVDEILGYDEHGTLEAW